MNSPPSPTHPISITPILRSISAFFQPRPIIRQHYDIPLKPNDIFGDPITIPINPSKTRLYFINLHGLNLSKNAVQFRDLFNKIRKAEIHLFAAAEHNLDTNKFEVRQLMQLTAKQTFSHHAIQTAASSIPADKFYKPGGTLLMAQGDITGRIKEKGSDHMGRWSWIKFIGRNSRIITVISAYQVCVRPIHATGTTAFHQQQSLL